MVKFINMDNIICEIDKSIINYPLEFYIDLFGFICNKNNIKYFSKKSVLNLRNKILEKRYQNIKLNDKISFNNFNLIII